MEGEEAREGECVVVLFYSKMCISGVYVQSGEVYKIVN